MNKLLGLIAILFSYSVGAVQVSVSVPASQLPVCPVGDPGQYVTQSGYLVCVASGSSPVVVPPSQCALTQAPNTQANPVQPGTGVQLTMACAAGNAPTACSWNGVVSNSCNLVVNPTTTTTYNVVASNTGGSSPSVSTQVKVATSTSYCKAGDLQYTINWPSGGQIRPATSGFGQQIASFKITIPTTFNPPLNINHLGFMALSEVPGTPTTPREITVSKNACDMQSGNYIYNGLGYSAVSPSVSFTVNNASGWQSVGADFNLLGGDVVYLNIRNSFAGTPACNSICDVLVDFATPNRY